MWEANIFYHPCLKLNLDILVRSVNTSVANDTNEAFVSQRQKMQQVGKTLSRVHTSTTCLGAFSSCCEVTLLYICDLSQNASIVPWAKKVFFLLFLFWGGKATWLAEAIIFNRHARPVGGDPVHIIDISNTRENSGES